MRASSESSSQIRNERWEGSRGFSRINRREWVPRGSGSRSIGILSSNSNQIDDRRNLDSNSGRNLVGMGEVEKTNVDPNVNGEIDCHLSSSNSSGAGEVNGNQESPNDSFGSLSSPSPEIQGRLREGFEGNGYLQSQTRQNRYVPGRQRGNFVRRGFVARNSAQNSRAGVSSLQNSDSSDSSCPGAENVGFQESVDLRHRSRRDFRGGNLPRFALTQSKPIQEENLEGAESNVPQLAQEIQEKLIKSTVECMICYEMVRRTAPIWSCVSCYSIFHLNCIKKWARAPTSIDLSAEKNQGSNWRCPGCQSVQLVASKDIRYTCFCGRTPDPPADFYLTPHSCGEPCGKPLERGTAVVNPCPHLCFLQCHPGPCPPCKAFVPPHPCPCGKKTITRRCSDQKSVLSCGQPCDKLLGCERHRCKEICHIGPCDPCKVLLEASCFCKKKPELILCGEMAIKGEIEGNRGVFSCNSKCEKILPCGNHNCSKNCHPGECGDCEFMPGRIEACHCGKTQLQMKRESCLDPFPTCSQVCGKLLPCGSHYCTETCHEGDCPSCLILVDQKCRCGSSSRMVQCYKTVEERDIFLCDKPCGQKKNCGRHRCSDRCCPLSNSTNSHRYSSDWDHHLCPVVCGKKLRCGQHFCEALCHSGHCPPCLETIFTDLCCACGKTSIPPPLPCGTPPPSCQHSCSVPQPCGHSGSHSCHFGECPPCSVPVPKECIGGHMFLRNIPCGSRDIRCNQLCGKTRQCGMHACARTCHPPPCDAPPMPGGSASTKISCGQVCGAPRRDCRHTCVSTCHPSMPCPDVRCEFPVTITCSCGRISAIVPCDAGGNGVHVDSVFEASVIQQLPGPLQAIETNSQRIPLGKRKLACDDECAKLERKKVLAEAFEITTNVDTLHFGENSAVSDLLSDLYRREPKWVLAIEERFKYLVLGKNKGGANSLRVHVFCAAQKEKRDAVRQIAERWKLLVHAAGREPRRFLVVHVTQKSKAPARILGSKGAVSVSALTPPAFDTSIDMDPRLVVAFLDLPRDADISALVLRFGGECELIWLNDKNALAVFGDPARAATALRRLDHGSAYHGAVGIVQNGGGSSTANAWGAKEGGGILKGNSWKKTVQEVGWSEDSWGGDWSGTNVLKSTWTGKEAPIAASRNPWKVLDLDSVSTEVRDLVGHQMEGSSVAGTLLAGQIGNDNKIEAPGEVDDWEEACE